MRILIVGGGVAGLTLAALLRQRDIEPVVIEKVEHYGDSGYQLGLWPLGNRVLRGLGLSERFREISVPFECWSLRDRDGRSLRSFDASRWMSRYGETRSLVRSELLALLRSFGNWVPVRLGCGVTAIGQNGHQVEVRFSDGAHGTFDLVVGADGINSAVRRLLFGDLPMRQTGFAWWGWWYDPGIEKAEKVTELWGSDRLFGLYPVPGRVACAAVLPRGPEPQALADRKMLVRQGLPGFQREVQRI